MYEFNLTLEMAYDDAMEKLRSTLLEEHLGIVSDVDVQAVFKAKMDKEIAPYHILGACNPKLAERVLNDDPNAGALLPCNVVIRQASENQIVVSFMDPVSVMGLANGDDIRAVAEEAREKLQRVAAKLG